MSNDLHPPLVRFLIDENRALQKALIQLLGEPMIDRQFVCPKCGFTCRQRGKGVRVFHPCGAAALRTELKPVEDEPEDAA